MGYSRGAGAGKGECGRGSVRKVRLTVNYNRETHTDTHMQTHEQVENEKLREDFCALFSPFFTFLPIVHMHAYMCVPLCACVCVCVYKFGFYVIFHFATNVDGDSDSDGGDAAAFWSVASWRLLFRFL